MKIKELMKWAVLILLLISSFHTVSAISLSSIPQTGVWVRVIYPGNFTGSIGSAGKMRPVTGSVDQFYQVPTVDGIVQALIQKQDGSGNVLNAEVYRNGTMVKNVSITVPRGTIDLVVDLKRV
jgi:hypothetical protein